MFVPRLWIQVGFNRIRPTDIPDPDQTSEKKTGFSIQPSKKPDPVSTLEKTRIRISNLDVQTRSRSDLFLKSDGILWESMAFIQS